MRNPSENSSFFSKAFASPTAPTSDPLPTQNITGSGDFNSTTLKNRENAEKIFPFKDGSSEETRLPPPLDENGDPIDLQTVDLDQISPELFNQSFHSAHQLELLKRFDGDLALGAGDERIDVLEGDDGRTVLILQDITKNDLAQLSIKDQTRIVNYLTRSDVPDDVKQKLAFQWEAEVGGTVEQNRETAAALVEAAREKIKAADSNFDKNYLAQLDILFSEEPGAESLIGKNVIFSLGSINEQIDAIVERFERMNAFEKSVDFAQKYGNSEVYLFQNSLDGAASMKVALESFVEQEKRLLEAKKQRLEFASSNDAIDLPNLVAGLQVSENIQKEVEAAQKTLELEQNNELVKYYAEIQRMVNEVQKAFNADKPEEERNIFGGTTSNVVLWIPGPDEEDTVNATESERKALTMFDSEWSSQGENSVIPSTFEAPGHPMEDLSSINRPLDKLLGNEIIPADSNKGMKFSGGFPRKTQAEWNLFATQLADAVTLINQRTQILTNDITSLNQEGNRHFEQMNNALRRSIDMINSIARTAG